MNNWTLRFRGVEVAALRSRRRGVRAMKVSAASRPAGGTAGRCVKALRTELGIKCHAAALGLGAGLRRGHPLFYVTSGLRVGDNEEAACVVVRHRRKALLSAPVPSLIVGDDGKRLRFRASLP
jgi:hypothetical protein